MLLTLTMNVKQIAELPKEYKLPKPCTKNDIKGSSGVLLVIGGSELYIGAPYYVCKAAYAVGIDLCYLLCADTALVPLKTLLPECIIVGLDQFDFNSHRFILDRITCCVVGPGLGRPESQQQTVIEKIIDYINVPLVVDGDGLHFWAEKQISYSSLVIFTPNRNEYQRYMDKIGLKENIVVRKGPIDIISCKDVQIEIKNRSGKRRCGGIGDLLCGIIATLVNFYDDKMLACQYSSLILRQASYKVFKRLNRSTMPNFIVDELRCMKL